MNRLTVLLLCIVMCIVLGFTLDRALDIEFPEVPVASGACRFHDVNPGTIFV